MKRRREGSPAPPCATRPDPPFRPGDPATCCFAICSCPLPLRLKPWPWRRLPRPRAMSDAEVHGRHGSLVRAAAADVGHRRVDLGVRSVSACLEQRRRAMIWPTAVAALRHVDLGPRLCTGCEVGAERPSMVTMRFGGLQRRHRGDAPAPDSPLTCTEQAALATPQPYLVPVSPTCSRITQSSGVSSRTFTSCTLPVM